MNIVESHPQRVLVVDDDESLRMTLAGNLDLAGFVVVESVNALQALELLEREVFDVVLSDIRMPGIDGVEMFRRIKQLHPDLPVVLMTAFTDEPSVTRAIDAGVYTVLAKPFDIDLALRTLHRAAGKPVVVVVDDVDSFAAVTAAALGEIGVRAVAAYDVESALALVTSGTIDVCVTDLVMPNCDGVELIRRLRALDPSITVIAFSGAARSDHLMRQATALGAYRCLRKPLDPLELARTIAEARGRA
jgi:DNA-binding NtrC family response regulator